MSDRGGRLAKTSWHASNRHIAGTIRRRKREHRRNCGAGQHFGGYEHHAAKYNLCSSVNQSGDFRMRVATGKVVGGKIVVEGVSLVEGATVTILAREDAETFEVSEQQEAELLASIAEADRGETIPAGEHLRRLRSRA